MARPNPRRSIGREDNLAARISLERERRGWSYEVLAKKLTDAGCPIQGSAIYKVEKGTPRRRITVDELVALSTVLETSVEDLLTPIELIRKEQAHAIIDRVEPLEQAILDQVEELFGLYLDMWELTVDDPELFDYVTGHLFPGDGDGEPVEWVTVEPASLGRPSRVETALTDLFLGLIHDAGDLVQAAVEQEANHG
jgi:transcriptional regulator with XRE-family HTH domain